MSQPQWEPVSNNEVEPQRELDMSLLVGEGIFVICDYFSVFICQ